MQDKLPDTENTPAVAERRVWPRFRVSSLICIDIGNVNGGIVTSLSENGLALTVANALGNAEFGDGPLRFRIQLPGVAEAIEASGEIVWTSPSGKDARARFVEIGDKEREQIRRWISDQASGNKPRPGPPKLPKMRLPKSRRAKLRASRFSFADVASSRVDGEDETGVEDFQEITEEFGKLPPFQAGGRIFPDGTEAAATALQSPAFTEDRTGKTCSTEHEQTAQGLSDQALQTEPSLSIPERRQHPRKQVLLFTYAELGEDNGGLVFNLGEGGLALTAAAALQEHHFAKMRVRFPDSNDWFETSGRLAWKNDTEKEAGIEFLNPPADARARIAEWLSQEELSGDLASRKEEAGASGIQAQALPGFMDEPPVTEPIENPASFEEPFENRALKEHRFEEQTRTPVATSSALFKSGIKGILEKTSVKRRLARIKPLQLKEHSAKPRTRVASKALSIAAGVALAVGGWMLFHRTPLNEASEFIAQNLGKTELGASRVTVDPSIQQTGNATPSLQQIEKAPAPNTPKTAVTTRNSGSERTSKEKPYTKDALEHKPVESSLPHSSYQAQHPVAPSQRQQETESPQLPASALAPSSESRLVESKPVQVAQTFPAQNHDLNATSVSTSANPSQPAAAPPVDLEKEKPPLAPKQPEVALARTPVVTLSFDPFPSIRMPKAEKSKKSRVGKSLQMGRLLSRIDPVYPEEARQQGVEGTVRLHAVFNRDGAVQSVSSVSGPQSLVPAAMNAVRQWRYSQTVLGGQAMETEEDVTVVFQLANSEAKN